MSKVKSISLDDMDEMPNSIGIQPSDTTRNKAMHYSPQYAEGGKPSNLGLDESHVDEGTVRKGGRFQISEGLTRFTQVLGGKSRSGGVNRAVVLAGVMGCCLIAGGLYAYLGDDYIDQLLTDVGVTGNASVDLVPPVDRDVRQPSRGEAPPAVTDAAPVVDTAPVMKTQTVEEIPGNPYWKLPNPVPPMPSDLAPISAQQSDGWRASINHPFVYQRLKATQEMRNEKVEGSVSILYDALAQSKFWTRMEAALGIAEHGVPIDTVSMRTAIGDTRSELITNYFKRFRKDYNDATAHLMRQAMRVVGSKARLVILTNLAAHRNEVNDQYLLAASLNDTDESLRLAVNEILGKYPVPSEFKAAYEKSISEELVLVTVPVRKAPSEIKVESIPANMNVEEVYFINDETSSEVDDAPAPVEEKKEDDGFNDLEHTEKEGGEAPKEQMKIPK